MVLAAISFLCSAGAGSASAAPVSFSLRSPAVVSGYGPNSLAVADFNADGEQDVAVAEYASYAVAVFLGDGNGGLTLKSAIGASPAETMSVATGDFNGDGRLDVAASNAGTLRVVTGNGDGSLSPAGGVLTHAAPQPSSVASLDLNGDGKPDLVAGSNQNNGGVLDLLTNTGRPAPSATGSERHRAREHADEGVCRPRLRLVHAAQPLLDSTRPIRRPRPKTEKPRPGGAS